ncbi:hypothetical protein AB0D32_20490 [Micromonospora sp. NPDC048170]|uniref:hypothetical protein n=1 Tax=Micromonospora sp. NPDC048170 TaxID=3154819 RepID=UPI003408A6FC
MRTVVNGRLGARLLVPGALLFLALGSPAVAGLTADGSDSRTVVGSSAPDLSAVDGGGLVLQPSVPPCGDAYGVPRLWDNLFPTCNRGNAPATTGGGVR